mmetsp:Transcript_6085/g.37720  ORF Transcript_6085/g.37720 Transcript_6085/m.37720 type:complete len:160 (+) Transcript_6085:90-569(+)
MLKECHFYLRHMPCAWYCAMMKSMHFALLHGTTKVQAKYSVRTSHPKFWLHRTATEWYASEQRPSPSIPCFPLDRGARHGYNYEFRDTLLRGRASRKKGVHIKVESADESTLVVRSSIWHGLRQTWSELAIYPQTHIQFTALTHARTKIRKNKCTIFHS